uniref:alpha-amylase n=1 Tax=Amphiprion ocellaris TaxID=80972 RepID=A0AAQ5XHP6_AMPOC
SFFFFFFKYQISPPNEHIVLNDPWRPWWQRYQPIGYKLCSRSGSENELRDMISRCNKVGVNIYVDVVINHMCRAGGGEGTHSSCGSWFNASKKDFPSVPYSHLDFNDYKCRTASGNIENYGDKYQVRDCRLVGLLDLALEKDYVRSKVADYMNSLIDMGVAGFRVDATKHMWPGDLEAVYGRLHNLNTSWFPGGSRSFIFQEVVFPKCFYKGPSNIVIEYLKKTEENVWSQYYYYTSVSVRYHCIVKAPCQIQM